MWLFEPVLQHMLEVDALPVTGAGVELDLERADADVAAALLGDGLQAQDLQVDRGGLLQGTQVHPQLSLQHLGEHQLGAELEEAAAGFAIHLHQGFGYMCGEKEREKREKDAGGKLCELSQISSQYKEPECWIEVSLVLFFYTTITILFTYVTPLCVT